MLKILLAEFKLHKNATLLGLAITVLIFAFESIYAKNSAQNYETQCVNMGYTALICVFFTFAVGKRNQRFMYSRINAKWQIVAPIRIIMPSIFIIVFLLISRQIEYFLSFKLLGDLRLESIFASSGLIGWTLSTGFFDILPFLKKNRKNYIQLEKFQNSVYLYIYIFLWTFSPFILRLYNLSSETISTPMSVVLTFLSALAITSLTFYRFRARLVKSRLNSDNDEDSKPGLFTTI